MSTRRTFLAAALATALARNAASAESAARALKRIHERVGGRLGVDVLDSQSGRRFGLDENSHYAMASTFPLCGLRCAHLDPTGGTPGRRTRNDRYRVSAPPRR